jgi:hypothetical protein
MSKASDVLEVFTSRPLSSKQIREHQEAEIPHTHQRMTAAGQIVADEPTQPPRVIKTLPRRTTD